jgi:PKD repeat protein
MDFTAPYTFTLDSARWGDGTYTIAASATMRDNFVTTPASATVTIANGRQNPPPNTNQWTPTAGTSPAPGAPLVLAAVGDGADGAPGAASTVNRIASWNPNLFLYLGDVYEDGTPMEFNNWYGQSGTASTYGQFRSITDPVIGNHEYIGNSASGYFYYWDNIPHYYSFNSHGWHFIALDSTSQFGQTAVGSGQYNWLAADLAANTSACTVVYYHHPILNVGPEASTTSMIPMWQLFAQHHVTLVLNGHDHDYQRFTPVDGNLNPSSTGITEIIVGSGGHGTQNLVTPDPRLLASDFADLGALKLNLFDTSATFQFQTPTGSVVDSGLIPCQNTTDTTAPTAPAGVTATANGGGEIDLGWSGSTDNVAVAGYEVYKDGSATPLATLAPDARSYADTVVAPNTSHSYTIKAFDAAGNRSAPGGPASTTTPDQLVTLVLVPSADAYVNSDSPTLNYGGADVLRVASPTGSSTATMYSYLRFDLSNVVGRIQSASLSVLAGTTSNIPFSASGVSNNTWDEYAMTFSTAPPIGSSVGTSGPLTLGSWSSVDVGGLTAASQGHLLSIGLTRTGSQVPFSSRETTTPPQLTIVVGSGTAGAPTASFSAAPTSTYNGVPVQLTDTSSGNPPTAWSWDFGDTTTSTLQNPIHSWAAPGTYTVSLVTSNIYGSSAPATAQITVAADASAPSAPGSVAATAIGPGEIDLSWSASTDNVGVTGYEIYRDGTATPLATVNANAFAYQDKVVAPSSTHTYTVKAFDAAGNRSVAGGPISATTPDGTVTYVLTPVADSYVDNQLVDNNFGSNTSLRVKNLTGLIMNSYLRFDLSNVVGQVQSASLSLVPTANNPGFSVSGVSDNGWGESTITFTNAPTMSAIVTSSGAMTAGVRGGADVSTLVAPAEGGLLSLGLTGSGGQVNLASRETATPPQLTIVVGSGTQAAPTAGFTSSATTVFNGDTVTFTDTSTGSPTAWAWDFGDTTTSTLQSPSHSWPTAGTYTVTLVATNTYGSSTPATTQITVNLDATPPSAPGSVTAAATGPGEIDVGWTASSDDRGVTGYEVYRDGGATPLASVTFSNLSYQDMTVAPGSAHSYTVQAFDAAGNHSTAGGPATATASSSSVTYVLTPVADSYVDVASPGVNYATNPALRLQSANALSGYLRFDLSNVVGSIQSASLSLQQTAGTGAGFSVSGVSDNTWGETTITYTNAPSMGAIIGSSGVLSVGIRGSVNVSALVAPAQGGLVSFGLATTGGQISLASRETLTPPQLTIVVGSGPAGVPTASFNSSATTALTGVAIQFTNTSTGNPPTGWSWDFGDGSLGSMAANPSHSWSTAGTYTVTLVSSNIYGSSAPATAQITISGDGIPPSAPGGVTATAAGSTAIDVTWTASTDNVAVSGYSVYRDGGIAPIATTTSGTLSFRDTPLVRGSTHAYTVDAFDAAGNHSALSDPPASATTDPTQTFILTPVADSYVDNINAGVNFGTAATVRVKTGTGADTQILNSYLRFDLSGISGNVQSASLSLVPTTSTGTARFIVHGVTDNAWSETAINYSNAPPIGAAAGLSGALTQNVRASVDVRTLAAPAEGGLVSFGLTGTGTQIGFASRLVANPPQLTIVVGADPQPSFPIRAAFYYPWFPESWSQQGFNPFTMYTPTLGQYDSSASTTLSAHLAAFQYGKIDVGISSWWGQGTPTDTRLPQILAATAGSSTRWSIYYEQEGNNDPSVSQITSDLTYLRDHYGRDPSYLRVNGHFVVFVYTGGSDTCSMVDRWTQANTGIGAYIVLKVVTGYKTCSNQPNGWHQYAPAIAENNQPGYGYSISPGFNKPGETGPRLVRDVTRWYGNVRDMIASAAPWQLVTTFSEWGEGTSVEDATEWQSTSGYGDYLDALHNNGVGP